MEMEMRELYTEGVATHGGPEPCVGVPVRAQRSVGQGYVQAGLLSREIKEFGVPTPLNRPEGNIAGSVMRELCADPARSENLCMYGIFMCENREIPWSPVPLITGRAAQGTLRRYA
jgi:hypothetical protein